MSSAAFWRCSAASPLTMAHLAAAGLWLGALPVLLVRWRPLGAPAASSYARLLAIKLMLFAAMPGLAAETALGLAVLAMVAVLGVQAPPTSF